MIARLQEQGYNSALRFGSRAFQYVTGIVMQTAIRVSGRRRKTNVFVVAVSPHLTFFSLTSFYFFALSPLF